MAEVADLLLPEAVQLDPISGGALMQPDRPAIDGFASDSFRRFRGRIKYFFAQAGTTGAFRCECYGSGICRKHETSYRVFFPDLNLFTLKKIRGNLPLTP